VTDDLVQRTVALSQSYRRAAGALVDEAHRRFAAGTLTQDEFNRVFSNYLSIVQKAMDVNNAATHQLAAGVANTLSFVEKDTATLCQKLDKLNEIRDLIGVTLKLLVAMGAIALAVLVPSPASAAAAGVAVTDALQTVIEARK
jgi:hypothetical protein